jgi:hypothetical protein
MQAELRPDEDTHDALACTAITWFRDQSVQYRQKHRAGAVCCVAASTRTSH